MTTTLDRHDIVILAGLALLAAGIGCISVAWSLIVIGSILLLGGLYGLLRRRA